MSIFSVKRSGEKFSVMKDGSTVAGPFWNRSQADDMLEKLERKAGQKERECIAWNCSEIFMSEGAHNRMCDRCRPKGDGMWAA